VTVDEWMALLASGEGVFDEPEVDGLSHALQCGAILRDEYPDDRNLHLAGLLHDIADIKYPHDHRDHAAVGADLVAPVFGHYVTRLVESHVIAKRYLVATDETYRAQLSPRSIETLAEQGGDLDELSIQRLARDRHLDGILALRRADERAKDPNAKPPGIETWRQLIEDLHYSI
jgi:predicted HD phosphohydrolase